MTFRKLQIAWSVMCGIAFVLLIALWVRSYWWNDATAGPLSSRWRFGISSCQGNFNFKVVDMERERGLRLDRWIATSNSIESLLEEQAISGIKILGIHRLERIEGRWFFYCPYFLVVGVIVALAAAPWLRFSLRTLLIATTLVAVVLGLIVWWLR